MLSPTDHGNQPYNVAVLQAVVFGLNFFTDHYQRHDLRRDSQELQGLVDGLPGLDAGSFLPTQISLKHACRFNGCGHKISSSSQERGAEFVFLGCTAPQKHEFYW